MYGDFGHAGDSLWSTMRCQSFGTGQPTSSKTVWTGCELTSGWQRRLKYQHTLLQHYTSGTAAFKDAAAHLAAGEDMSRDCVIPS